VRLLHVAQTGRSSLAVRRLGRVNPKDDYDTPWKAALERYFEQFLALFLPAVHAEIDWGQGCTFLDKELRKLVPEGDAGPGVVDVLVRVTLRSGDRVAVSIHVEVQRSKQAGFGRRMLRYNLRIFDRFDADEVVSVAVLGDEDPAWRPSSFDYGRWGSRMRLEYLTVKLIDWEDPGRWRQLQDSSNPFAIVVMAHLKTLRTGRSSQERLDSKVSLVRALVAGGHPQDDVHALLGVVDWFMALEDGLQDRFEEEVAVIEEETKGPLLTSWERRGLQQGLEQGLVNMRGLVARILENRFGAAPEGVIARLREITELSALNDLAVEAAGVASLEQFMAEGR
jgi:hypothetical protein